MGKRTELPNINAIGTADNPVTTIHVKNIAGVEKIYYTAPVYTTSPDAETIAGVKFNTGTGNLEFSAPIVSDMAITGKVVVTGNMGCTGYFNLTGAASKGFKPNSDGDIEFFQDIVVGGDIDANGGADFANTVTVNNNLTVTGGRISCTSFVSAAGYIESSAEWVKGEYLRITDSVTAPGTTAGQCKIYMESGSLKAKNGSGVVAVLTTFP